MDSASSFPPDTPCPTSSLVSSPSLRYTSTTHSSLPKGNRISMACNYCRKRKIKCTGELPCKNCVRTKRCCVFEEISDEQNRLNKARKARNRAMKEAGLSLKAEASDSPADDLFSGVYARRPSLPRLQGWTPSSASTSVPSPSEFGVYPSVLLPMPNVKFYPSVLSSCPSPALSFENSSAHSSPSTDSSPLTPEFDHDSFDTSRHPVDGQRYTSYSQPPPYFNQGHFYPPQPACSFPWLQASFGNPSSPYTPSPNASLGSPFGHLAFQGPNVALNTGLLGITLNEEHAPRGSPAEPLKGLYASSHEEAQVEWSTSWCI